MLYEWKRSIEASAVKDFQESLKKIELVHLLEVEEATMGRITMPFSGIWDKGLISDKTRREFSNDYCF